MYYISITPENELQYYCRNCGNIDDTIASENICVSKVNMKKNANTTQSFANVVNKYTKLDPTLPRIKTIRCPNDECSSNKGRGSAADGASAVDPSAKKEENEVIYYRYDDTNLKYIYLCTKCDKVWNTEQH